jgi:hypothetical protein
MLRLANALYCDCLLAFGLAAEKWRITGRVMNMSKRAQICLEKTQYFAGDRRNSDREIADDVQQ